MTEPSKIKKLLADVWALRGQGKYNEARKLLEEVYNQCSDDDFNSLGRIFHIYMQFEADHANYVEAEKLSFKSIDYYKEANDLDKIAHSTRHLADLQFQLGKYEESLKNYSESIEIYRSGSETHAGNLANALRGFGILLEQIGENEKAIEIWKDTIELYKSIGLQEGVDEAQERLTILKPKL